MKYPSKITTHHLLALSYVAYFIFIAGGLGLSIFFPLKIVLPFSNWLALACFVVGPFLIVWAQYSSVMFEKNKKVHKAVSFLIGPYKFLRNPTQLGIGALVIGYACILQSATFFAAVLLSYIVGNYFYKKHEALLQKKYGQHYTEYRSRVNKIL